MTSLLRRLTPAALLLALATPALGGDLAGMWGVEGTLPDGTTYSGQAALSPSDPGSYRIQGSARLSNGRSLTWTATGERTQDRLEVVHRGSRGLAGRIMPSLTGSSPRVVGRYDIASDERSFEGTFQLQGTSERGRVRYQRLQAPRVTPVQPRVRVAQGDEVLLSFAVDPTSAAPLLWADGDGVRRHRTRNGHREVLVAGETPGIHKVSVRLGPPGGTVLAEVEVEVVPAALDDVVQRCEALTAAGQTPVVIFDLDDTLFDTRYRVRAILRDYGAQIGDARLEQLSVSKVHYDLTDTLRAIGFSSAEINGNLGKDVRRAWSRAFFGADAYDLDGLIRGAVAYVERLTQAGAHVVYVTGRREATRQKCVEVLQRAGYPAGTLYCKPDQTSMATADYKERVTRNNVSKLGRIVAAFDNEPDNCNAFRRAVPQDARVVWLDTLYKPDHGPLLAGIDTVADYR
ncbi:MAG: HAD family hydrolase [Planctomycetota bacterium]